MAKIIITIEDTSDTSICVTDDGDTITNTTDDSTKAQIIALLTVIYIDWVVNNTGGKLMSREV